MTSKPSIGFCGLGAMGFGMATHLVKQGYPVTGFDVYEPSLARFQSAGGTPSASLAASAKDQPFYIVMVASQSQAQPALFDKDGIVAALPRGATLLLCSTVPSAYAKSVEKDLVDVGRGDIYFIDAPVSGGAGRAAEGALSIMAGSSDAAMEKGRWLLQEMAAPSKLYVVHGGVGAGSNMKMVHQVLAAIHILAASEAHGFAARLGLNGKEVLEAVVGTEGGSWMFEDRSERMLKEDYFPGASAVTIILKDTSIITSTTRHLAFCATLCTTAEQVFFSALDHGLGADDDAGLVRLWTREPLSTTSSTLPAATKAAKLKLVVDLLTAIHVIAAAEAFALADRLFIRPSQFYQLACDAAGASAVFKQLGPKMISYLRGEAAPETVLKPYTEALKLAVGEAQESKCPLYLGTRALDKLLQAGPEQSLASLLTCYRV